MSRWSCSAFVMRCCSCHRELFQSLSGTSAQNPRPADRNCLREVRDEDDGGSSPPSGEVSLCICAFRFSQRTIDLINSLSSGAETQGWRLRPKLLPFSLLGLRKL